MTKLIAALTFLALNSYVYWYMGSAEVIPPRASFDSFPDRIGDWQCQGREKLDDGVVNNLQVSDYLSCIFTNEKRAAAAHVYIGYHKRQTRDRESGKAAVIHPPEHCLPGAGWDVIESEIVPIDFGHGGEAKRFVIAKGNERRLVYFWYQSRGHVIARSPEKILWMFYDRATRGRTDGSLVRFTIPVQYGDFETAEETFRSLSSEVTPLLSRYVPD
jgi:EpsI family protein